MNYPPYGFHCPYTNNCPHLNFLSTQWVFEEYERADEVYREHLQIIDRLRSNLDASLKRIRDLEKENAELKAKNTVLHRRQFKANKKLPEASPQSGKKRGAPVGHPGWCRTIPARVNETIHVPAPDVCPHCRRSVMKAGEGEMLHAPIGPVAKSVAVYLRYRIGMTYRKVEEVMRELFGLAFVPASALGFDRVATKRGEPLYEDLREKVRVSEVVHADETSWRNNGKGHYAWYAGNEDLALFHIDRHRSTEVAQHLLGVKFDGILITDRYAAYNGVHAQERQTCLAHLITRAREITRELLLMENRDGRAETFCKDTAQFFSKICAISKDLLHERREGKEAARIEKQCVAELRKICKRPLEYKPAEALRTFLESKD